MLRLFATPTALPLAGGGAAPPAPVALGTRCSATAQSLTGVRPSPHQLPSPSLAARAAPSTALGLAGVRAFSPTDCPSPRRLWRCSALHRPPLTRAALPPTPLASPHPLPSPLSAAVLGRP
ncbi:hypothetical protein SETIT_2G162000v2 [Setaria italica]|uniref:Uncharacterized protein n=2 Tax=Setaria TaxID=4554 RepID=A0A368Q1L3_SETIT|nr:hypothetical protein SETIT_2G162000v2 [Setaria italica]TKW32393.1 hypothetical protein SEVIR_2G166300v2 [Setaria viridis]